MEPWVPSMWWGIFHETRDLPEALVQGKELLYLTWFFNNLAYNPSAVTPDINEFVSHYSAPGAMCAGFEYYRAFHRMQLKIKIIQRLNLQCQYWR